jgi:hypothetical protein
MNYEMWIGNQFYSRDSYLKEAKKMGASKKVAYAPHDLVVGETKVYLISDMSEKEREEYYKELKNRHSMAYFKAKETGGKKSLKGYGPMPRGQPYVFGYFIVNAIIQTPPFKIQKTKQLPREDYPLVEGEFGTKDERGCGSLKAGSIYLISETSMEKIKELYASPTYESENVIIFDTPIEYYGKRFRGMHETGFDE